MSYHKQEAYCTVQKPMVGVQGFGVLGCRFASTVEVFGVGRVSGLEV